MSDEKVETVEIGGLKIPKPTLDAAERVILEWGRGSSPTAYDEAVKVYKIIHQALQPE